ncbi:metal ABC transporter substrate-binding protein [Hespellia stercorisuis]|uniref:Zinc transport system substrate-binding protein n=1 Tax=Hespellia stercorisuis DSM 15480 TaxID=1121950 RepID=A0A1M6JUL8_9FIRM|nr:metal ABC transporter substrate-binding protein [Hespellia stercorisuis]SHJ50434.1 zinc transport system substrate-binding protein [Hespellia stercorisuis DSM 15480]
MKKVVRIISICLSVILLAGGCVQKQSNTDTGDGGKVQVVTTIFPPFDFVRQIAGDYADIRMLLKPGAESHSYEPTPQDIIAIQNCDVFVYTGGENDTWVDSILESMDTSKMQIISMTDCVETVEEEVKEGMFSRESHEHGEAETHTEFEGDDHDQAEFDEHVWTSPVNAVHITEHIAQALIQADPVHEADYRDNTETYTQKLTALDQEFRDVVSGAGRKEVVFGDRFPLRYFVDEYGLDYYAAFPGCAEDTEPSAATIAFLIDKVKEDQIPVVFKIELSNGNIAGSIAEAAGAKVETFYTCHNISAEDYKNGETYLSLMERNVGILKEALN